ncbi:MAG: hypothetical protein BAA00_03640 [Parageobacillus thermoglucosidasius]|nr:MAG: hypothetical protein BAA00_03640 [Parageobacillus thermoglucosidasius]
MTTSVPPGFFTYKITEYAVCNLENKIKTLRKARKMIQVNLASKLLLFEKIEFPNMPRSFSLPTKALGNGVRLWGIRY